MPVPLKTRFGKKAMAEQPVIPTSDDLSPPGPMSSGALLHFVLRQAKVRTNVCSRQTTRHGYELERRTVPDHNLIHILRGRVVWVIGQTEYPMNPGDLVIVPPGVPHHAFSHTQRVDLCSLHLQVTLPGGQDVFSLLIPPRFQHVESNSRLARYLTGYASEFQRRDRFMAGLVNPGWGRMIAMELLWHDARHGLLTHHPIEPLIPQILAELGRRLSDDVTLKDLASWAGYSPQHLNRVFRKVLGVTPLQHLTRMRLEHAAGLLEDDTLTLQAIASAVGIDDPYYFSRLFKQHYHQSPAHYRQALDYR
jgi:AraC-like DNA-binding protein/quercetin dioxygenase-like cupin family protein